MNALLVRAIAAFIALPGVVAFAAPVWIGMSAARSLRYPLPAVAPLVAGTSLLLWCVREFYVAGRGTLGPWHPPEKLVTTGAYRMSRNPMYVGVLTILLGWCTLWNSPALVIYTAVVLCAFHLRVVFFEEPWAARRFGAQWQAYRARVPRWLI